MKITADTNLLVRAVTRDGSRHAKKARDELSNAELVAITPTTFCELTWVLNRLYKAHGREIADAIRLFLNSPNVVTNRPSVEAGLAILDAGGDFADGVIAHEGAWLGAQMFVSFDKEAVRLLQAQGRPARLPAAS